jgi:hypothetical protein
VVGSLNVEVPFSVFFFGQGSRLVVTDIDGTITESDVKGVVYPQLGMEAHQVNYLILDFFSFTLLLKTFNLKMLAKQRRKFNHWNHDIGSE